MVRFLSFGIFPSLTSRRSASICPVNHLLYDIAQGRCRGDMTRVNSFSILAGSVACPTVQSMRREGSLFVKIAYCLIISRFRIEDYMSIFRIASTSLPPIYVGVYLLSRYL